MKLHARAALAALLGATFTVAGCGKSETDVEIPSLNDPVTIGVRQEESPDELDASDPITSLPTLPGGSGNRPLEIPASTSSSTP